MGVASMFVSIHTGGCCYLYLSVCNHWRGVIELLRMEKTRLEARVTPQQKKMFAQAAAVSGMSLADQEQLAAHVLNPPQAPARFKELAKWRGALLVMPSYLFCICDTVYNPYPLNLISIQQLPQLGSQVLF
jgi:hypothetical protein